MATKPTFDIQWATDNVTSGTSGNPNKLEPFEFKSEGQQESQPVPRPYLNFQFDAIRQWKDYLEEVTDDLLSSSGAALLRTNNLSDLTNTATARTNLGLSSVATSVYADATQAATGTSTTTVMSPARVTDHFTARTTSLTRAILGRTDAPSIRSDLGLGTAGLLNQADYVQTAGNQSVAGTKTFTSRTTFWNKVDVGTDNNGPVDCVLHMGFTPIDFYGFQWVHSSNALAQGAGTLKLQRGTAAQWLDALVIDNSGTFSFTNAVNASITGSSASVANGVYTVGNQTIGGIKTFSSTISGNISGNAATVTNGVYTSGNQTINGTKTFTSQVLAPSFRISSDPELKDKLVEHKPVANVDKIKLMQWVWKQHDNVPVDLQGKEDSGVDASVVKQVFPNCVGEDSNGFLVVDYAKLAVHLLLAKGE